VAKLVMHNSFSERKKQLRLILEKPGLGRFIFIVGPTGVGKTTIRRSVLREIVGKPEHWGPGRIPVIEVFALLAQQAYFNSQSLAESLVDELFVPDIRWLRDEDDLENLAFLQISREIEKSRDLWNAFPRPKLPERKSWVQFKTVAPQRSVWLAAIDQAAAMCTNHKDKSPADHISNLISIVEMGKMNILLSGVHGTADLWTDRPEIRGRSDIIWMPPYSAERKEDRDPFLQLLRTLGNKYRFSRPKLLFGMADDLMAASAGIFGVLKKILEEASDRAHAAGHDVIHKNDIVDSIYGDKDLKKLWEDVRLFEDAMKPGSTKVRAAQIREKWNLAGKRARTKTEVGDGDETAPIIVGGPEAE